MIIVLTSQLVLKNLQLAPVLAANLGAGAALVLVGMVAEGTAHIEGVSHVDRGYEKSDH